MGDLVGDPVLRTAHRCAYYQCVSDMHQSAPGFEMRHRLALALEVAGVSSGEMAEILGVHRNTVSNYLNGRATPKRAVLVAWAVRCGVPLVWLITGREPDPGASSTIWYRHGTRSLKLPLFAAG